MNAVQQALELTVVAPGFQPTSVTLQPVAVETPVKAKKTKPVIVETSLHRVNLRDYLFQQDGKIVGITFTKLDGQTRVMTGRIGVRKHLKGGRNNVEAADRPYLTIYDLEAKGYRTVSLDTVTEVRAERKRIAIVG